MELQETAELAYLPACSQCFLKSEISMSYLKGLAVIWETSGFEVLLLYHWTF